MKILKFTIIILLFFFKFNIILNAQTLLKYNFGIDRPYLFNKNVSISPDNKYISMNGQIIDIATKKEVRYYENTPEIYFLKDNKDTPGHSYN